MEKTYRIEGMTCGHCTAAVEKEIRTVAGVGAVEVDLGAGVATVTGEGFTDEAVAAAVDEAGFVVVGAN
jgi:copper chaperone